MFKGYYTLASGMISQNRNLDVVSNNMTNSGTPGFKKDRYFSTTFQDRLVSQTGSENKRNPVPLGDISMIRSSQETITDYRQGALNETGLPLDFALSGQGFFQVQGENGIVYTRNGSFIIDDEGYLALPNVGRVLGQKGTIKLDSDSVVVDSRGTIFKNGTDVPVDKLAIVDFADYTQLTKRGEGLLQSTAQGTPAQADVISKTLERSNVSPMEEMTAMMTSQRAIQSVSQILKMYDQMMAKATTEIGRV